MSRRPVWETVHLRFDPAKAAGSGWRADRPNSPAAAILRALDRPIGDPRVLLTGTVGTGKTTELLRLVEQRREKDVVVFLDLERHFTEVVRDSAALQRVSTWEVCLLAGLALIRVAKDTLGYEFPEQHLRDLEQAWLAVARATETPAPAQLDVPGLVKAMSSVGAAAVPAAVGAGPLAAGVSAGLAAVGALASALKWTLPLGLSKRPLPDQNADMQTLLACVNVLIGLVQQRSRRVLIVLDGLDRVRELSGARALFVDSQLISRLACPLVVSGPIALRHDPSTAAVQGFVPHVLVNEPVLLKEDPARHGPGVGFFCELFDRRTGDLGVPDLISRPLLEELAYRSGGRARDFVHFIRDLALLAWDDDLPSATPQLVRKVLDDHRRRRETGLDRGHIRLLAEIAADPEHRLPQGELARVLLGYGALLPYPNESEWYYPHPLLMMSLVRMTPAGSPGSSSP